MCLFPECIISRIMNLKLQIWNSIAKFFILCDENWLTYFSPHIRKLKEIHVFCRYMGTITGISDLDPVRWKNSQWRNLQVVIVALFYVAKFTY